MLLVEPHGIRQVFPAPRRAVGFAVYRVLNPVEVVAADIEVGQDGRMNVALHGVGAPDMVIGIDLHDLETVHHGNVKFPHRAVELRWVSGCDDNPAIRYPVCAEGLVLQKLQHGRRQCFGHTVDLVEEQDALPSAAAGHGFIDGGNDLAHGVLRHLEGLAVVFHVPDLRQTQCALPGVMRHRIGDQADPQFRGNLFHNCCLADSRGTDHKDRALTLYGNLVLPMGILFEIDGDGLTNLFLCFLNIHVIPR